MVCVKVQKLFISDGSTSEVDKILMQQKYENAIMGDRDLNKKMINLGELNELANEDLILSIDTHSSIKKVAFGLVRNGKSLEFLEGNCKIAWDRWVTKYALHLGVNVSENYSPVVNDITFHILLLMIIHFGFLANIFNVETAFLFGDLEGEINMECPQGMTDVGRDDCIISNKCKAAEIQKKLIFVGGFFHLCLYFKNSEKGIV